MRIEFQPGNYRDIVCDVLAYPVFEDECKDFSSLQPWIRSHVELSNPPFLPSNSSRNSIKPAESANPPD